MAETISHSPCSIWIYFLFPILLYILILLLTYSNIVVQSYSYIYFNTSIRPCRQPCRHLFIKLPFFKSPFCIVVQLSFLYRLVIRIVLLFLSDSVSFVAILFEVFLAVPGVALFSFLFILLYFILFSAEMSYLYSFLDSCSWLDGGNILVLSSILCMFS